MSSERNHEHFKLHERKPCAAHCLINIDVRLNSIIHDNRTGGFGINGEVGNSVISLSVKVAVEFPIGIVAK